MTQKILADALEALENLPVLQHTMDMPNRTEMELFMVYATGELSIVKVNGDVRNLTRSLKELNNDVGSRNDELNDVAVQRATPDVGNQSDNASSVTGDISSLTRDMQKMMTDVGSLTSELGNVKGDVGNLAGELALLNKTLKDRASQDAGNVTDQGLGNENGQCACVHDLTLECRDLRGGLGNLTGELGKLREDMWTLTVQVGSSLEETVNMTDSMLVLKDDVQAFKAKAENYHSSSADLGNLTKEVTKLKRQTTDLTDQMTTNLTAGMQALNTSVENLNEQTGNLRDSLSEVETDMVNMDTELRNFENVTAQLKLRQALKQRYETEATSKLAMLTQQMESVSKSIESVTAETEDLKRNVTMLTEAGNLNNGSENETTTDTTQMETSLNSLKSDVQRLKGMMKDVEDGLTNALASVLTHELNLTTQARGIADLTNTVDNLTSAFQPLLAQSSDLETLIENKARNVTAATLAETTKLKSLMMQMAASVDDLTADVAKLNKPDKTGTGLTADVTQNKVDVRRLQLDVLDLTDKVEKMNDLNQSISTRLKIGDTITLKNVSINDGLAYNASSGIFTAPANGNYLFIATIGGATTFTDTIAEVALEVDDLPVAWAKTKSVNWYEMGTCTHIGYLQQGQRVKMRSHYVKGYFAGDLTSFSGLLLA
nr:hypothetical protein BaRGS_007914 [Batillaria attramentaria]